MVREKISGIYCIENIINGKKYIGQSKDVGQRLYGHKSDSKNTDSHLYRSIKKHGWENFKITTIKECDISQLDYFEKYYIKKFKTYKKEFGYNKTMGGTEYEVTDETREKIINNKTETEGKKNSINRYRNKRCYRIQFY